MDLFDVRTWSQHVKSFMEENLPTLLQIESAERDSSLPSMLFPKLELFEQFKQVGNDIAFQPVYHCTRLTDYEISTIIQHGMYLPDLNSLIKRLDLAVSKGLLSLKVAEELKSKNEADAFNRKDKLHFLFRPPYFDTADGVERFFRYWGGEALYNSYSDQQEIINTLSAIGVPCIVEMSVNFNTLESGYVIFESLMAVYLNSCDPSQDLPELCWENCTTRPVLPSSIRRIYQFPESAFIELSGCETWDIDLA